MHPPTNKSTTFLRLSLLLIVIAGTALAQGPTGEITGTVTDSSLSAVPNASVTLVNAATGLTREINTNQDGVYTFPALNPGSYTVTVRHQGFQSQARTVEIQVQQTARLDFALAVGEIKQTLEVSAAAEILATEDATVGQVIDNKRIVELPLNGRNYLQLTALSPGVNINAPSSSGATQYQGGMRAQQALNVNGQRIQFNHYTLDGVENTDPNFNSYILLPTLDALQEFKVQSATYPAEFGWAISQINVSTRSGSNAFHGSAFEFVRNSYFDAKNFFDKPNQPIPPFRRNQFGATAGGAILKNKLFFFGDYDGLRQVKSITALSSVPLESWRNGDFTGRSTIYDPATRALGANGVVTAQPFPGNIIPSNRFDPHALAMLQYYPLPSLPGTRSNYINNEPLRNNIDQYMIRIDYHATDKLSLYGRFNTARESEYDPTTFPQQGQVIQTQPDQVMLGATYVFGPALVNELRLGWTRFDNKNIGYHSYNEDINGKVLKLVGINPSNNPAFWGLPTINVTGYSGFGEQNTVYLTHDKLYQVMDSVSWVKGKHNIKFGIDVMPILYNQLGNQYARGAFTFDGTVTQNPASPSGTGDGLADLLIGFPKESDSGLQPANAALRGVYWAPYVMDSWRATPKLTIDLGLRYELLPPLRDVNDASSNVSGLFSGSPVLVRASNKGSGLDPYQGALVRFPAVTVVRDGRLGAGLVNSDLNNLAPRLGLAYSATPSTVIRAGFGMYYDMLDMGNSIYDMSRTLAGLLRQTTLATIPDLTLEQPFRLGSGGASQIVATQPLILANSIHMRHAYVEQWSFDVQRTLTPNLLIEASYVGSQGHRLKRITSLNLPNPGPGSIDANRPIQLFGYVQMPDSIGNSNYNALQVKVERRFAKGFTLLSGYTFGKSIDDTSGVRPGGAGQSLFVNNPANVNKAERSRSDYDSRHRWITSALYSFPVWNTNALTRVLAGGWQLGGIFTFETGYPCTPADGRDIPNTGVGSSDRPNATGISTHLDQRSVNQFFNTAAFAFQPLYTYGNAGRNTIQGPGIVELDMSLMKSFKITEERHVELRGEMFNVPNHPNFSLPDVNLSSPTYGRLLSTRIDSRQIQIGARFVF